MAWPFVISGVAAGLGAAATAATLLTPVADGGTQVWLNEPLSAAVIAPGRVVVTAHATDPGRLDGLELKVDGKTVDDDRSLDRSGLLVFAVFEWKATPGAHELVVGQLGGAGTASDPRVVTITGAADPAAPTRSTPTPTPKPSDSPSASPLPATSTPTPTPTSETPPEPEPVPVFDAAAFVGTPIVYQAVGCPYQVQVQARIQDATSARAEISGTGSVPMSRSSSTWTATIGSGFSAGQVGDHTVTVIASGAGGSASRVVGTLTIKPNCPKD